MPTTIDPSSARLVALKPDNDGKTRIRNKKTGEVRVLHGYGGSEGKFEVRKGIDLTKPIYGQVMKLEARAKRRASAKRDWKRGGWRGSRGS